MRSAARPQSNNRCALSPSVGVPLGGVALAVVASWSAIGVLLLPYGGLPAVGPQAGETLLVSAATGNLGSAGVAVGLGCVPRGFICPGRNWRR